MEKSHNICKLNDNFDIKIFSKSTKYKKISFSDSFGKSNKRCTTRFINYYQSFKVRIAFQKPSMYFEKVVWKWTYSSTTIGSASSTKLSARWLALISAKALKRKSSFFISKKDHCHTFHISPEKKSFFMLYNIK